jgi:hypothetical protein
VHRHESIGPICHRGRVVEIDLIELVDHVRLSAAAAGIRDPWLIR